MNSHFLYKSFIEPIFTFLFLSPLPRQVHGNFSLTCTNLIWLYWARYLKFTFSTFNCFPPNLKSGYIIRPRKIANRVYWMISRFALLSKPVVFQRRQRCKNWWCHVYPASTSCVMWLIFINVCSRLCFIFCIQSQRRVNMEQRLFYTEPENTFTERRHLRGV